jgi:predicted nucleic acid-binding protein
MTDFLDTNVLIRYITQDNPDQGRLAHELIDRVRAGTQDVTTCEGVIVETVQVLSSPRLYNRSRAEIQAYLTAILNLPGFRSSDRTTYLRAMDLYASTNLDFVDVLEVAHMEKDGIGVMISFDRGFDRLSGITRREP